MTPADLAEALRRYRFRYADEYDLQQGIADALALERIPAEREVRLDDRCRVDLLAGAIVVEVKIAGSVATVRRQLERYAAFDRVEGMVLVTGKARHRFPATLGGKPLEVVSLVFDSLL